MLSFAGAHTGFLIMSPGRDSGATAAWLSEHLADLPPVPEPPSSSDGWSVDEFPLPRPTDLPHDVAGASDGRVSPIALTPLSDSRGASLRNR